MDALVIRYQLKVQSSALEGGAVARRKKEGSERARVAVLKNLLKNKRLHGYIYAINVTVSHHAMSTYAYINVASCWYQKA